MSTYVDPMTGIEEEEIGWGADDVPLEEGSDNDFDGLLGFDFEDADIQDRSGLRALINSSFVPQRRFPALEVIFDRASSLMTSTLRHLVGDTLDVHFESISSTRFNDFMSDQNENTIYAPVKAKGLDLYNLLTVDSRFIFSTVDFLLGGHRSLDQLNDIDHEFTSIELSLAKRVLKSVCNDLSSAFSSLIDTQFELDRVESNRRFAAITPPASICVIAKFRVDMGDSTGYLRIVLPYTSLELVGPKIFNEYSQDNSDVRDKWRKALMNEVSASNFNLSFVLAEHNLTLGQLSEVKVGDILSFDTDLNDDLSVMVGDYKVASAVLGRDGDQYAVRLKSDVRDSAVQSFGEQQ